MTDLDTAVDELYAAFAEEPRPRRIDFCAHCWSQEETEALLAPVPVREVPAERIRPYAADVLSTVGGADDFRYFLPRMLHIATGEEFGWPDLDSLAGRLRRAEWHTWPERRQRAITELFGVLWENALSQRSPAPDVDEVLCAIGNAGLDPAPYLASWGAVLGEEIAAEHLLDYLSRHAEQRDGRWHLLNGFWKDAPEAESAVADWLSGVPIREAINAVESTDTLLTISALL